MTAGFRCKQFFVDHAQCAMKVSTDALLLGAWCQVPTQGDLLDIGTGSGILALMLAQRSFAGQQVDAIELDPAAAAQAKANTQQSPWANRIRVIEQDILTYPASADHFDSRRYQLIISNPPYFSDSLLSDDPLKTAARHNQQLPFAKLLSVAAQLSAADGEFALILPCVEAERLLLLAPEAGWQLKMRQEVASNAQKSVSRSLLLLSRANGSVDCSPILLPRLDIQAEGCYSEAYRQLLKEFYLKF